MADCQLEDYLICDKLFYLAAGHPQKLAEDILIILAHHRGSLGDFSRCLRELPGNTQDNLLAPRGMLDLYSQLALFEVGVAEYLLLETGIGDRALNLINRRV
ncbi:MAG: hypothetical protein NTV15_01015 [Candidatus Bathyarchaeota archaeon]|nr:hypothetical protein [Candidatus Bathyarchaeota archaeon]